MKMSPLQLNSSSWANNVYEGLPGSLSVIPDLVSKMLLFSGRDHLHVVDLQDMSAKVLSPRSCCWVTCISGVRPELQQLLDEPIRLIPDVR